MGETRFLRKRQLIKLMERLPGTVFQYQEWPDGGRSFPYSTAAIEKIFFASPKALAADGNLAWSRLTGKSAAELRAMLNRSALQLEEFQCVIQTSLRSTGISGFACMQCRNARATAAPYGTVTCRILRRSTKPT